MTLISLGKKLIKVISLFMAMSHTHAFVGGENEAYYRDKWCDEHGGTTKVVAMDGTRPDCVTKDYAIEVDWAHKWYEGLGQALHYSLVTGLKPGIVLIMRSPKDNRFYLNLIMVIKEYHLPIRVWTIS